MDKYYEKKDLDSFMSDISTSYLDRDAFANP